MPWQTGWKAQNEKKVQACTESQRQEGIQYWIKVASPRTVGKMGILIYGVGHPDDDLGNRSLGIQLMLH